MESVKFSSHFVIDQGKNERNGQNSSLFDCAAILNPYVDTQLTNFDESTPIVCLNCAAYLCSFSSISMDTGEWMCQLCKATNPSFSFPAHTSATSATGGNSYQVGTNGELENKSVHTQLKSNYFEYREDVTSMNGVGSKPSTVVDVGAKRH